MGKKFKMSRLQYHQTEQRSNKRAKNSRCQDRTTKWTKDQINGQKIQDIKITTTKWKKSNRDEINGQKFKMSRLHHQTE